MKHETDDRYYFGQLVRKHRLEKDIGLREFADKIGISATYLSRIENGLDLPPSGRFIVKMAEALGLESNILFEAANKALDLYNQTKEEKRKKSRIPPEVYEAYKKSDVYAKRIPEFLRIAKKKNLSDKDWKKLIKSIEDKNND